MSVARRRYELAGEQADEPDWAEHEARAGALAEMVRPFSARSEMYSSDQAAAIQAWIGEVRSCPPDVTRSLLLLLIRRAAAEGGWSHDTIWRVHGLRRSGFGVPAVEAAYVLRAAAALPDTWWAAGVLACAAALAARTREADDRRLVTAVAEFAESVRQREYVPAGNRNAIARSLARLHPPPPSGAPLDTAVIAAADGWSAAVLAGLAAFTGAERPVNLLLHHLKSASGSKPTKTWLARAAGLLVAPEARRVLRLLLEAAASPGAAGPAGSPPRDQASVLVGPANASLLRAAAWAASCVEEEWVVPALTEVARRGSCGTHLRHQAGAALRIAAERAGLGAGELAERIVTNAGLDGQGERLIAAGGATARLRLAGGGVVSVQWRGRKGWVRRVPAAAGAAGERAVRAAMRQVGAALAGERGRLEGLLAQDRGWAVADWRDLYCEHPVTGVLSRGLLWTFEHAGERVTGMPETGETLLTLDGVAAIPADGAVRLWHPVRAGSGEIAAWRDLLVASGRRQPLRQVFREVYLPTAAELAAPACSGRFERDVLRYPQAYALMTERGWAGSYLGPYDGGPDGRVCREFPDAGLTAVFEHHALDVQAGDLQVELCRPGRVSFHRTRSRARAPVRIADVPDLVFTEAMRDVDLIVSATSIALDPRWGARTGDPHFSCWQERACGELGQAGLVRRDALTRIVPVLTVAGQLELTDRYLLVHGKRHDYKIHLGSANVSVEPERYLCIGPVSPGLARPGVPLPFDDDRLLSEIVSRALALAADDEITDPALPRQLRAPVAGPRR